MENKDILNNKTSERIFVFMGSYEMIDGIATLTYNSNSKIVYKKYRDLETGETITVNISSVELFENENKIIHTIVDEYTQEEYEKTYEVIKETYYKELSSSNKEEVYKLIKRLTPLK